MELESPPLYNLKSFIVATACTLTYLLLEYFLIGFKSDQLFLVVLFNVLYFAGHGTRQFILAFSIYIIYWIIFDNMKAFPNYLYNDVRIESLYTGEKNLFGFVHDNIRVTPNEYFAANSTNFLDILCGLFYLCWIPVPLAFAVFLYIKNRNLFYQFSFTFFLVNVIGFIGYYIYPAAPPWYVQQYGFDFVSGTPGNTAGLSRFDALVGIPVFASIYAKSSNVFAAMPSLHAAYMLIVVYYSRKLRWVWQTIVFFIIALGIWFTAVYTSHHYVLDILAGIGCAMLGIAIFQLFIRTKWGNLIWAKLFWRKNA